MLILIPDVASGVSARTRLVSVGADGTVGEDFHSYGAAISHTGRFIAFVSRSNELSPNDSDDTEDIYVRDLANRTTELVSVNSDGVAADGSSDHPAISADGRFVAFDSFAANLVANDGNGLPDVFVHDRETGTTERVSVSSTGTEGDGYSYEPAISANGRFVVFTTESTNLVPNDTLGFRDVLIHDRTTDRTRRVSLTNTEQEPQGDSQDATVSADGNLIAFMSGAPNMIATGNSEGAFVRDRAAGTTRPVSVSTSGVPANGFVSRPAISASGRFVVFESDATNLANDGNSNTDVFVRDRKLRTTTLVSRNSNEVQGNAASYEPAISASGRFVTFTSDSTNLVRHDENGVQEIFLRDRKLGTTRRVAVTSAAAEADAYSDKSVISGDGRFVAFESGAVLVAADTNALDDVYVRGPLF
jgi:Tol biopolymer transport system component